MENPYWGFLTFNFTMKKPPRKHRGGFHLRKGLFPFLGGFPFGRFLSRFFYGPFLGGFFNGLSFLCCHFGAFVNALFFGARPE